VLQLNIFDQLILDGAVDLGQVLDGWSFVVISHFLRYWSEIAVKINKIIDKFNEKSKSMRALNDSIIKPLPSYTHSFRGRTFMTSIPKERR